MRFVVLVVLFSSLGSAVAQLKSGSLDRKPALPSPAAPAPAASAASGGIKLDDRWDTPTPLMPRGPLQQRKEFHALLTGFAEPGTDTGPHPGKQIYREVTYLMPMKDALARFGLTGVMQSGGEPSFAGFPAGLKFAAFSAQPGRSFEVRVVYDRANQVVATEFAATNPNALPPGPLPPPDRSFVGQYYDFLPRGDNARGGRYGQAVWDLGDRVLIATRGGPKSADLYIPKPMVSIILHCLDRPER